jgi:hypothetical protein
LVDGERGRANCASAGPSASARWPSSAVAGLKSSPPPRRRRRTNRRRDLLRPVQRDRGLSFLVRTQRGAWPPRARLPPPRPPRRLPLLCWGGDGPPPPPGAAAVVERRGRSPPLNPRWILGSGLRARASLAGAVELRHCEGQRSSAARRAAPPVSLSLAHCAFFLSRAHCAVRKETETRSFNGSGTHNTLQVLTLWAKI